MKTNKKHSKNNQALTSGGNPNFGTELQSRSEQLSGNENRQTETATAPAPAPETDPAPEKNEPPKRILPYVNFQQREANRALATDEVLEMLRQWAPQAYDLAEIVGKWIWITFPEPPAEMLRGQLSQFGFHWNNYRKSWQHPCGTLNAQPAPQRSEHDPREKYGSRMAAAA